MMNVVALCAGGVEKVVANELRKLELPVLDARFGRVRFRADLAGLYRALMSLRVADRVLLEAGRFSAPDFDALFEGTSAVEWEAFIPKAMGLRVVKVRVNHSRLQAETTVQAMTHKAAAARLCKVYKLSRLPDTIKSAELRVYIEKDEASLLLDLSGEALFKRGYRREGGVAPLRETTAAALFLLAGWRRKFPLYDPFCGSGTIAIEAALYAWDMAPGLGRAFALSDLGIADPKIERIVREELAAKIDFSRTMRIFGSDADAELVRIARINTQRAYTLALGKEVPGDPAPLPWLPDFHALAMKAIHAPTADAGFIITNPPYGKRLGDRADSERTYQEMEVLSRNFPGWKIGVISNHTGFESFFGRKADSCRELTNGALQSYFFMYE
ncbi:MAG: class I SAM-dependent RNA methyltransferase [Treponema sp.]|jgi:putative N6-adenine-specific DNA methylase|nr:class I SAM-dependent RNA methyltransferase [Treponema sp.]